jgi:parallel beta-helix repeat protein
MAELVTPEDGMVIERDTTLQPGIYYLPNGLFIAEDNVTLDGNGALIIGKDFNGRGVRVNQRLGVTVKNIRVERFYHGIWINASANVRVEHCHVTRTHELPSPDTFLDVWLPRDEAYGGGIFLSGVKDSFVTNNDVQHQQSGIMLYGCNNVEVTRNNASFNSGYGMLLFESSQNLVEDNVADFCCRVYASNPNSDTYDNGADAAALVMMCNSSQNIVRRNRLRSGGDGVFLGGFHKDQVKVPCNDNLFELNDGSYSPNIAFEATFSQCNVFRNNRADNCAYGFWLGWSSETTVQGNSVKGNRIAGVAIEHGHHNTIGSNAFERNGTGVQLWVNSDGNRGSGLFRQFFPDCAESYETEVSGNSFTHNDFAVRGWTERPSTPADASLRSESASAQDALPTQHCHHFRVTGNTMSDNRVGVQFERVRESAIQGNRIAGNLEAGIKLIGAMDVSTAGNDM